MTRKLIPVVLLALALGCADMPNAQQIAVADAGAMAQVAGRTYFATACSTEAMDADPAISAECVSRAESAKLAKRSMDAATQRYRSNPSGDFKTALDSAVCAYLAIFPEDSLDPFVSNAAGCN